MPDQLPRNVQHGRPDDGYKPLQLIGVIVLALLGFAVFFLSFLLAPLAILVIFYVGFAAADRNQRSKNNGNGHVPPPEEEEPLPEEPPRATPPVAPLVSGTPPLGGPATPPVRPTGIPVPAPAPEARPDLLTVPAARPR